jgi:hypothetical protein
VRAFHLKAFALQKLRQQAAKLHIIVDHQDSQRQSPSANLARDYRIYTPLYIHLHVLDMGFTWAR